MSNFSLNQFLSEPPIGGSLSLLDKYKNKMRHETLSYLLQQNLSHAEILAQMQKFEKTFVSFITRIPATDCQMPDKNKDMKSGDTKAGDMK